MDSEAQAAKPMSAPAAGAARAHDPAPVPAPVPALDPQAPALSQASKRLLPWLVAVALFMESLDTTILNTAVPAISHALNVGPLSMKSVLASYTLSLAVFIPISGWMADRFGTRRVFASAIGLFTLGSLLCGISSDIHLLVACRVLQGCGGAMMVPVGRLTLVRTFAKSELLRAMSFISIPALVAPMLGPIAGGLIVGYLHWRYIFFLNIPIGLAGLVMVYLHLPNYSDDDVKPLDTVGLILFGSGIALLSYVLEIFGEHALSTREICGLLTLSLFLLSGYILHARHMQFPLLQLELFRIRTFRAAVSGSFFTRLGMGGVPFLLPLLYQIGLGFTAIQSGLLITPQALGALSMKFVLPRLTQFPTFDRLDGKSRELPLYIYEPASPGAHPVLIVLHDGPDARFRPTFDPWIQYVVNELGFAVLAPNVRGSSGYGKTFGALARGDQREDAIKDIGALLVWLALDSRFDKTHVIVSGAGYGGYMALAALVNYGERLRGAVAMAPITDFIAFVGSTAPETRGAAREEYGDERDADDRLFLRRISPLINAERITRPVLIAHGQNDRGVPLAQSDQLVLRLRVRNRTVWYLKATDEGGSFARWQNREAYYRAFAEFLDSVR